MNVIAQETEKVTLEHLRKNFEVKGYQFIENPTGSQVPDFLRGYRPDALALGPNENVVIEVKQRKARASDVTLAHLAQRVSAQDGWRFIVVYSGEDEGDAVKLKRAGKIEIDQALNDARSLEAFGFHRHAFVAIWSILEALARRLYSEDKTSLFGPLSPIQVIQRLAMDGYVGSEDAKRLQHLISLRNLAVHGELNVNVPSEDIAFILKRAEEISETL